MYVRDEQERRIRERDKPLVGLFYEQIEDNAPGTLDWVFEYGKSKPLDIDTESESIDFDSEKVLNDLDSDPALSVKWDSFSA